MSVKNAHYQVTNIFDGQSFYENGRFGEYFSVFTEDGDKWTKKAIHALKKDAERFIPKKYHKDIMYDSVDIGGRRSFMWRHGDDWWVNRLHNFYTNVNRQIYGKQAQTAGTGAVNG